MSKIGIRPRPKDFSILYNGNNCAEIKDVVSGMGYKVEDCGNFAMISSTAEHDEDMEHYTLQALTSYVVITYMEGRKFLDVLSFAAFHKKYETTGDMP